jgi:hypothetical protein
MNTTSLWCSHVFLSELTIEIMLPQWLVLLCGLLCLDRSSSAVPIQTGQAAPLAAAQGTALPRAVLVEWGPRGASVAIPGLEVPVQADALLKTIPGSKEAASSVTRLKDTSTVINSLRDALTKVPMPRYLLASLPTLEDYFSFYFKNAFAAVPKVKDAFPILLKDVTSGINVATATKEGSSDDSRRLAKNLPIIIGPALPLAGEAQTLVIRPSTVQQAASLTAQTSNGAPSADERMLGLLAEQLYTVPFPVPIPGQVSSIDNNT